jgi:hypothetical protein
VNSFDYGGHSQLRPAGEIFFVKEQFRLLEDPF